MFNTNRNVLNFATALDLPPQLMKPFLRIVDNWCQNSGIEWTVSRMKEVYVDFLRFHAGVSPVGKYYQKTLRGLPRCASGLFAYSLKGKKQLFAVSQLLRIYTSFIASKPTEKQVKKFLDGVNAESISIPSEIVAGVVGAASMLCRKAKLESPRPYLTYRPSPSKRVPHFDGRTYPEPTHWSSQWVTLDLTYSGQVVQHKYRSIFDSVLGFQRGIKNFVGSRPPVRDHIGKIGLIQEPGYKLRAVANPNRVYQVALEPLGDCLYDTIRNFEWDCTHDQSKGIPIIQEHLQNSKLVHCVDLTGATDYFPLSLQVSAMKAFIIDVDKMIDLFVDLSRGPWLMGSNTISWKKGQPLGLYPSFASFAFTHGLLLYYLNGFKHENAFFVLGDDVVILDDALYLKYVTSLQQLGCPISDAKSINSRYLAEFAGKIIYPNQVVPQLKWRQFSDDSFVDCLRLLGMRGLRLLRPRQRKAVKAIWDIPETFGGLGFNPDGLPFADRYEKYLSLFGSSSSSYLMSYDRQFQAYFYAEEKTSGVLPTQEYLGLESLPDLDLRSLALVSDNLPSLMGMYKVAGYNLYSVVPSGDLLPIEGKTKARVSLLETIERKFK